jgi:DNA-binding XRE family transcriptional regulator
MSTAQAVDRPGRVIQTVGVTEPVTPRERAAQLADHAKDSFGRRLAAWREHKGFSRKELGFYTDISDDTIRILEEGRPTETGNKRPVDLFASNLLRISLCLGVPLDDLMLRDPPPVRDATPPKDG